MLLGYPEDFPNTLFYKINGRCVDFLKLPIHFLFHRNHIRRLVVRIEKQVGEQLFIFFSETSHAQAKFHKLLRRMASKRLFQLGDGGRFEGRC